MDNMEDKLNAILGNPQMMQQIMAMAQNFSQPQPEPSQPPREPEMDPGMLAGVMRLAGQTGPDREQQMLLKALRPYLTARRIDKLEKAMRAAKLAGAAAAFLGTTPIAGR